MEARCEKFYTDSLKLKKQDINKLKSFLYKNQDYKFKENEKIKLFTSIEQYVSGSKQQTDIKDLTLNLLEDALQMPFNVFSTSQKQKMLKWLEQLQKEEEQQKDKSQNSDEEFSDN